MSSLVASIIPHAVAVALSPMPIAALILLLLSNKARANSIAFLIGWVLALFINVGLFMWLFKEAPASTGEKSTVSIIISIALGVFLLWLALKEWKSRPKPGVTPKMPKWMEMLVNFSPAKAFLVAFGLVTINAKNTVLDIATGVQIGQGASSLTEGFWVLTIYVFVASLTILFPTIAFLILGNKMNNQLNVLKEWTLENNATILFVLFLYLGVSILAKAFGG